MDFSQNPVVIWLDKAVSYIVAHKKESLGVCVIVGGLGLGFWGYRYYKQGVREQAHKAFISVLKYYDGMVREGQMMSLEGRTALFGSEQEKWQKVEQACREGHAQYHNSELAPLFQVLHAEALEHLGKKDEALKELQTAVDDIPSRELRAVFQLKRALKFIDVPAQSEQGLGELKKLAEDSTGVMHESALYYIGAYYWGRKEFDKAKNYWQQLLIKYGVKNAKYPSVYAQKVKEKLDLLSSENL